MSCMSCHRPSLQLRLGRPVARPLAFVPHRHLVAVRAVRDADIVDPRGPYKFPAWVTDAILEVQEPAALEMAQRLRRAPVEVPGVGTILTACAGPEPEAAVGGPTIVMLHGFDSSCLEFRRFLPLLDGKARAWAVDLVVSNARAMRTRWVCGRLERFSTVIIHPSRLHSTLLRAPLPPGLGIHRQLARGRQERCHHARNQAQPSQVR